MGQISLAGQALAFHQLASNGIVTRTAANTIQAREILAGNGISGIAVSNGNGVSGSPSVALSGQALAVHQLATNGLITRTSAGIVAGRTISAGTGVSVSNGDGVSGNPSRAINVGNTEYTRDFSLIPAATTVNYLGALGSTYALGTVPAGFRFVITDTFFLVDTVAGTVAALDTMPKFRIYNSTSSTAIANTLSPEYTPFTVGSGITLTTQFAYDRPNGTRQISAAAGDTIYARVTLAYSTAGGYTTLNGRVLVRGFLLP